MHQIILYNVKDNKHEDNFQTVLHFCSALRHLSTQRVTILFQLLFMFSFSLSVLDSII